MFLESAFMVGLMTGIATIGFLWLAFKLVALGFRVLGWLLRIALVLGLIWLGLFTLPVLLIVGAAAVWELLRTVGIVH